MAPSSLSPSPSAYTRTQIQQYESHISLPHKYRQDSNPPINLAYLTALHVHQIAAMPYENLSLHYSASHTVSLDPQVLFRKTVGDKRGRGGYCMENSILFYHVLKALGFAVYMAGVRIRPRVGGVPGGEYTGWVHVVNIIALPSGSKYHSDVGFGGDGATKPLPLIAGHVTRNLGSQEIRLVHEPLPHSSQQDQLHFIEIRIEVEVEIEWIYQYRNSPTQPWNAFYAFPELEFSAPDFEIMSYFTSTSTSALNFQTRTVLIVRFLLGRVNSEPDGENGEVDELNAQGGVDGPDCEIEGEGELGHLGIVGKIMLVNGEVKRNDGGKTRVLKVCESEDERVAAFEELFGITLTEEEMLGVEGRNVELGG
ncbi:Arylamine N-acetyltransferase,liver isozyme [Lachnellula hyalina]|uniref:Arylamine N-acetyltransferase,liver isozyme n=1 Tax=Lachnellula hyalina TaxID=1316788 RepID=A0A8H8U262_9HELO|nr:Arylamine N-acetyltransferase,liver isozyme [Lachnellula hyalina]TVY30810.1 Arylamine N-acetyltransferase,liver isozyme [Lachnellula hyalina]